MMISILMMFGTVAIVTLCGYLLTYYFAENAGASFIAGCSFPLGASYYVIFFVVINRFITQNVSYTLPLAALIAAAGILTCTRGIKFPRLKQKLTPSKTVLGLLLLVMVLSSLRGLIDLYHDTTIHFQFAAEIANGKFPPSLPGTFNIPFPYHSGYDILFGSLAAMTSGNYIDVYLFLTVLFECSTVLLLFSLIHALTSHRIFSSVGVLIMMLGTGLLGFLWHELAIWYRLFDMLHQHPWKFAAFIVLLISAAAVKRDSIDRKRLFILVVPLLPFTGYFAGQIIPFAFAGILILYGFSDFSIRNRMSWLKLIALVLLLTGCIITAMNIGGPFERDTTGAFTAVTYSFASIADFFRIHDTHNGTAGRYYFFDTTFALIGYLYVLVTVWKKAAGRGLVAVWEEQRRPVLLLVCFGFFWYLSPLFIRLNYFWNNFCKFNYVGIIIGMLCFVFMAYRLYMNLKYRRMVVIGLTIYVLCLVAMQIGYLLEDGNTWKVRADLIRYREMIRSVQQLDASKGFVTYGVPDYIAYRLGVNLLNPMETYNYVNRYAYLPHEAIPDVAQLEGSGISYIVAADDSVPQIESLSGSNIKRLKQGSHRLWAIYALNTQETR